MTTAEATRDQARLVPRRLGVGTATLVVAASMIGTGVFTTSGLLLETLSSPTLVLLAWLVGGVVAACGALTYGELVAAYPRNGGEYHLLSELYHPAIGFIAGWVSLVVGFSAPIAAAALACGKYVGALVPSFAPRVVALVLVLSLTALHAVRVTWGASLQNALTAAKVLLIAGFVAVAARQIPWGTAHLGSAVVGPGMGRHFAVALVFVAFSYSGYNGAAYLSGEVREPRKNLPVALVGGTALVTALYLALNTVILFSAPSERLVGVVEVGHVAAVTLLGQRAGAALSALIGLALASSVSAMIMLGPRVYEAMGQDYPALVRLRRRSSRGGPLLATALQAALAVVMLLTTSFEALLVYVGFTLSVAALLTVAGVFVHRRRGGGRDDYRTWGYPVTPLLFIVSTGWMVIYSLIERPTEALFGGATVLAGYLAYLLVRRMGGSAHPREGERT